MFPPPQPGRHTIRVQACSGDPLAPLLSKSHSNLGEPGTQVKEGKVRYHSLYSLDN